MYYFIYLVIHLVLFEYIGVVAQSSTSDSSIDPTVSTVLAATFACGVATNFNDRHAVENMPCIAPFLSDLACRYGTTVKDLETAYNANANRTSFTIPHPAPQDERIGNYTFTAVNNCTYQACMCTGSDYWKKMKGYVLNLFGRTI
jgi:hypothetical protein